MVRYKKSDALRRRQTNDGYRKRNLGGFQDPFPEVNGTLPEKIVFARLIEMQIPFIFQGYLTVKIPEIKLLKDYRPDFILPQLKLIIEVQGAYFHSMDKAILDDAYKATLYNIMGYRVASWWDYEILGDLDGLFARDPQLNIYKGKHGGRIIAKKQSTRDDSKGIRTAAAKRRQPYRTFVGTSRRKIRKSISKHVV